MKHYFVLNPAAGKGKAQKKIAEEIRAVCSARGVDYSIYITKAVRDAENFVRRTAFDGEGGGKRFYLCGGDGTFNEGVNGAFGAPGVSCGMVPVGTGNDFPRNFTGGELFLDVAAQLDAAEIPVDLLRYGEERYCVNMMNIGFDCQVVQYVSEIKRNPLIPGKFAYIAGVVKAFVRMPGVHASISFDGSEPQKYDLQLTCIGNGAFCGGGFKSLPFIALDDGRINVCAVRRVSRPTFIRLIGRYKKGTYVSENTKNIITYAPCHRVNYDFGETVSVCVDGEVEHRSSLSVEAVPHGKSCLLPAGSEVKKNPVLPDVCCPVLV